MTANASSSNFPAEAKSQESRIDELLTARRKRDVKEANWSDDITDPEFKKNLCLFQSLVAGAVELCARQGTDPNFVSRVEELTHRIQLPGDKPLTLPLLLTHRFALEQVLAELGDETYLRMRAAALYAEPPGSNATWGTLYNIRPPLVAEGRPPVADADAVATTRAMVISVLAAKQAVDLPLRARRELKQRILWLYVLPAVFTAAIVFGIALFLTGVLALPTLAVSATAAMTGAMLGRLIKLRDEVTRGAQVIEFMSIFIAQVAVGLITGLFVSVAADQLKLLNASNLNGLATICFIAGFSEAAFLGLVSKIDIKPPATGS